MKEHGTGGAACSNWEQHVVASDSMEQHLAEKSSTEQQGEAQNSLIHRAAERRLALKTVVGTWSTESRMQVWSRRERLNA
jgi:hypothetical protein